MQDNELIREAVEAAQEAFWAVVAQRFPEIPTGDVDPGSAARFDGACYQAVWGWLDGNLPPSK